MDFNLERFVSAQQPIFAQALDEIENGHKTSHWMWFVFPQLKQLGSSPTALFYGIGSLDEATAYWRHPILGKRLAQISEALLTIHGRSANEIFGKPDDRKLQSCMTLFSKVADTSPVFERVLEKYFLGQTDERTVELLNTGQ